MSRYGVVGGSGKSSGFAWDTFNPIVVTICKKFRGRAKTVFENSKNLELKIHIEIIYFLITTERHIEMTFKSTEDEIEERYTFLNSILETFFHFDFETQESFTSVILEVLIQAANFKHTHKL